MSLNVVGWSSYFVELVEVCSSWFKYSWFSKKGKSLSVTVSSSNEHLYVVNYLDKLPTSLSHIYLKDKWEHFLIYFVAIFSQLILLVFLFLSLEDISTVDSPSVEEGWFSKMPSLQLLHLTKHRHNILASRRYHWFLYYPVLWIYFTTEFIIVLALWWVLFS